MTRAHRRDDGTKNASVCTGLRLEPDLARRLCTAAVEQAEGDVAQFARYILRTQLGASSEVALVMEPGPKPKRLCGLALDDWTWRELARGSGRGMHRTAYARHLLRLGLGISDEESARREERFAALATALKGMHER